MTLREKNHEPTTSIHRKYSVSQSGKYKSRPKIRPSLGDLFRPDASSASGSANHYGAIAAEDGNRTGSGRGQLDMTTTNNSEATSTTITQQSSRGVYETAL